MNALRRRQLQCFFGISALALHICAARPAVGESDCDPSDPAFICGLHNPEDIVRLPSTRWVGR